MGKRHVTETDEIIAEIVELSGMEWNDACNEVNFCIEESEDWDMFDVEEILSEEPKSWDFLALKNIMKRAGVKETLIIR